ncbi:MAG TPA: pyridoxal-dependent decarboxylase [Polyangiaceae bacterium]|nr:pyridoxal-dependent decarboxylase [Polyangiaceae bacterium]
MAPAPRPGVAEIVGREVEAFLSEVGGLRVAPDVTPEAIRAHLEASYAFDEATPLADALPGVMQMLRDLTLHCTHPRYFGLFNPSVHEAGVWADALVALYNPQLAGWAHAPGAIEIERHVLRFFARALGFDAEATAAHFTSGGSEANQTAVVAALAARCPEFLERGLAGIGERPAIYVSSEGHHSFRKIARAAGLGERSLRVVPADRALRFDLGALAALIEADRAAGLLPALVVGTAGTTGAGAIDDLEGLAALAAAEGAWLHVDAAWGGAAALSPRLRGCLRGIERADSVTWDAHKWLSVPMGAGMFFCRHPAVLRRAFSVDAGYVPAEAPGGDPYLGSLQWSRRFIGLKVFLTLVTLGEAGLRAAIEHQAALADRLREKLAGRGWAVVNDTPLPLVCFTHRRLREGRVSAGEVAGRVQAGGRAWVSEVPLGGASGPGERALRACVTSFRATAADLDILLDELDAALEGAGGG